MRAWAEGAGVVSTEFVAHPVPRFGDAAAIKRNRGAKYRGPVWALREGRGPADQSCGTCAHLRAYEGASQRFFKCHLWGDTASSATDIRKKDPACVRWEAR